MSDSVHIVCPHCAAVNRVPGDRLAAAPTCGKCHRRLFDGRPAEVDTDTFQKHLTRDEVPLLVDFWAPWCGPCKIMAPHFVKAAVQLEPTVRLLKADVEANQSIGASYRIRNIPTLALFRGGQEIARQAGAMNRDGIIAWARTRMA